MSQCVHVLRCRASWIIVPFGLYSVAHQSLLAWLGSGQVGWCYANGLLSASEMNWGRSEGQSLFYPTVPLDSFCTTMHCSPQKQFPRYGEPPGTYCVVNSGREPQCFLTWVSVQQSTIRGNYLNDTVRLQRSREAWPFGMLLWKLFGNDKEDVKIL